MIYPSSRTIATSYNSGGRISAVTGYASGAAYAPFGGVSSLTLGNGVVETTHYDSRLRMTSLDASMSSSASY